MGLTIISYRKGPLTENTYLIIDEASGYKAIVDPGYYGEDLANDIDDPASLKYVLLTHGHFDHFAGIYEFQRNMKYEFVVPSKEEYLLYGSDGNQELARYLGSNESGIAPNADIKVTEGDSLHLGESLIKVIETPGHTEGGVCYLVDDSLFSGDTLFRLSVGNTSFKTGNWETLRRTIHEKLFTLSDEINVYPGHGDPTTIGYEKKGNPFV